MKDNVSGVSIPAVEEGEEDETLCAPTRLKWVLDSTADEHIAEALRQMDALIEDNNMAPLTVPGVSAARLGALRLSPDSFMQLVLQLAFYRDQGRVPSTYESATTRPFLHGRTGKWFISYRRKTLPIFMLCYVVY